MREEAVNVPESAVVAAVPTSPERARNVNGGNGDKRQNPTHSRHATKCRICNHPDRHAIEFEFLNWRNPADLARSYTLRDLTTIYRHAHATGLFAKRRLNLRFAMERIVERVNEVPVTAASVIRAARAISRINDSGEWVDPPSRLIVTHIHAEDSSFVGAPSSTGSQPVDSSFAGAPSSTGSQPVDSSFAGAPSSTGSQPVDSSVEVSSEDLQARAGTEGFVGRGETCPERSRGSREKKGCLGGRGFSPDRKSRSLKASIRARQGGEGNVPSIPAHDSSETISRPALIFDDALLDEPSESASAELPRIDGKPAPPEVILQLTPEFARCREERRRALEADRQARAASGSGGSTPPASPQTENVPSSSSLLPQAALEEPAPALLAPSPARETRATVERQSVASPPSSLPLAAREGTASAVPSPGHQTEQSVALFPSLLPQAAFPTSASSALPHPTADENNVADVKQRVAMPSSSLPPRAAGPPLGSSGSANPPFPFTPEPLRRWKPRRRF